MNIRKIILESIRGEYEEHGVEGYYEKYGNEYHNPHADKLQVAMDWVIDNWSLNLNKVLDLAAGSGEITKILQQHGYDNVDGIDPYTCDLYRTETNKECLNMSFDDIRKNGLGEKYDTIVCSYALHLYDTSKLPTLVWQLSRMCDNLILLSPHKKPEIGEDWGVSLRQENNIGGIRVRWFKPDIYN
jgi:2-polyprenyl-3-methyl-5-hydroxy-6-metoxy-1,4-benzoquinol methylase